MPTSCENYIQIALVAGASAGELTWRDFSSSFISLLPRYNSNTANHQKLSLLPGLLCTSSPSSTTTITQAKHTPSSLHQASKPFTSSTRRSQYRDSRNNGSCLQDSFCAVFFSPCRSHQCPQWKHWSWSRKPRWFSVLRLSCKFYLHPCLDYSPFLTSTSVPSERSMVPALLSLALSL